MRYVRFDPKRDYGTWTKEQKEWWDKWDERSKAATKALLTATPGDRRFNSSLWGDLKAWLLDNFFNKKCAYCEVNISAGFFGEGEHFRPKGSVRIKTGEKLVPIARPGGAANHGGYYWLAYDARNLVPSCDKCNNHKVDQFPIRANYIFDPPSNDTDLDMQEQPLLIHPCYDDPSKHLKFGLAGTIAALDERGRVTIEVFNLERGDLAEERKRRQEEAETQFLFAFHELYVRKTPLNVSLNSYMGEGAQFSAAVRDHINSRIAFIVDELKPK